VSIGRGEKRGELVVESHRVLCFALPDDDGIDAGLFELSGTGGVAGDV
jgi:hypothetical protein